MGNNTKGHPGFVLASVSELLACLVLTQELPAEDNLDRKRWPEIVEEDHAHAGD
jgi:hypothetical protein